MRIALLGDLHYPDVDSNNKELSAAVDHFFLSNIYVNFLVLKLIFTYQLAI